MMTSGETKSDVFRIGFLRALNFLFARRISHETNRYMYTYDFWSF